MTRGQETATLQVDGLARVTNSRTIILESNLASQDLIIWVNIQNKHTQKKALPFSLLFLDVDSVEVFFENAGDRHPYILLRVFSFTLLNKYIFM